MPTHRIFAVARIDAVQAEYSPFETIHEIDGLVDTARELNIAFVAYGPLGHGWLVDDFPYQTPDDFEPDDYRRCSKWIKYFFSFNVIC
jgi:aryl-alcohol dehydrogenase-like predicted oxidoreductase